MKKIFTLIMTLLLICSSSWAGTFTIRVNKDAACTMDLSNGLYLWWWSSEDGNEFVSTTLQDGWYTATITSAASTISCLGVNQDSWGNQQTADFDGITGDICLSLTGSSPYLLQETSCEFASGPISVTDGTLSDWDNLPQEYVYETICAEGASLDELKKVKVYADAVSLNFLVEWNSGLSPADGDIALDILFNVDPGAATGGYGDYWTPYDNDFIMEGVLYVDGIATPFEPGVFAYGGAYNTNEWNWSEVYVDGDFCLSQRIGNNQMEIKVLREALPNAFNNDVFTVGFMLLQYWNAVGVLPNAPNDEWGNVVKTDKLIVRVAGTSSEEEDVIPAPNHDFEDANTNAQWHFVQDGQANYWVIGSGAGSASEGSNALYITNDGYNYAYEIDEASSVSWAYLPVTLSYTDSITFSWKGYGESCCDYLRVYLLPNGYTPQAGNNSLPKVAIALSDNLNMANNWQHFAVMPGVEGEYNLCFMWQNDYSVGQTPIAIDNVFYGTPGEPVLRDYTITLQAPNCGGFEPAIIGSFCGWMEGIAMTRLDNGSYQATINSKPGDYFKFKASTDTDWSNEIQILSNGVWINNPDILLGEEINIHIDYSDGRYTLCDSDDPTLCYTLNLDVTEGGYVNTDPYGECYTEGTQITLTAEAYEGYQFSQWSDGNTDNPRLLTMTEDIYLTAEFTYTPIEEHSYTIRVKKDDVSDMDISNGLYLYWWKTDEAGQVATMTLDGDGWYTTTITTTATSINCLAVNVNVDNEGWIGQQTTDYTNITGDICLAIGASDGLYYNLHIVPCEDIEYTLKHDFEDANTNAQWHFVQDGQANYWVIGSGAGSASEGDNALYITNNGYTYDYDEYSSSISWAYIPIVLSEADQISFDWKCTGEANRDYLNVYLLPAGLQPESGNNIVPDGAISLTSNLSGNAEWQKTECQPNVNGDFNLCFMWINDGSVTYGSPIAIDNVFYGTPGEPALRDYTITLQAPNCGGFEPAIIGDFNGWVEGVAMELQPDGSYKAVITSFAGQSFKFKATTDTDWSNEIQILSDGVWVNNPNITLGEQTNIYIDYSDGRYSSCEDVDVPSAQVKGDRIWPIILDDITASSNASKIVADFRVDDIYNFLYLWDVGAYVAGDVTGLNFHGNTEGYLALTVTAQNGWSGLGFYMGDESSAAAAEQLRQRIIANPDNYYLHFAMKATTQGNHQFYTFNTNATSFAVGAATIDAGQVIGDFPRDGEWYEFDVPMADFADALATSTFPMGGNIFCALSGATVGSQLNLDALYFYEIEGEEEEEETEYSYTIRVKKDDVSDMDISNGLYLYWWKTDEAGQVATMTLDSDGWYTTTITTTATSINCLAVNVNVDNEGWIGQQTTDYTNITGDICLAIGASDGYYYNLYTVPCDDITCYTLNVLTNNDNYGYVDVLPYQECYLEGEAVTLTAMPYAGCEFVEWSDGVTDAVRTINMYNDMQLTAIFRDINNPDVECYTLTLYPEQLSDGQGGYAYAAPNFDCYEPNTSVVIRAYAAPGYVFSHWSDGDTNAERTIIMTQNLEYTAYFEQELGCYQLNVTSTDGGHVDVTPATQGCYEEGTIVTLAAVADEGFEFVQWNDGNKEATRVVVMNSDCNFHATFTRTATKNDIQNLAVTSSNLRITAKWSSLATRFEITITNNKNEVVNSEKVDISEDNKIYRYTAPKYTTYTITVKPLDAADNQIGIEASKSITLVRKYSLNIYTEYGGTVNEEVNGEYTAGTSVEIIATPNNGYRFLEWSDGDQNAKRTLIMDQDYDLMATFKRIPTYTLEVFEGENGLANIPAGSYTYQENEVVQLTPIPNDGYLFDHWVVNGVNDTNETITLTMTQNYSVYPVCVAIPIPTYTLTILPGEFGKANMAVGTYTYNEGEKVTLLPVADADYLFDQWVVNGEAMTDSVLVLDMVKDYEVMPTFVPNQVAVENIYDGVTIMVEQRTITVLATQSQDIALYDLVGHLIEQCPHTRVATFTVPSAGLYLVRTANGVKKIHVE